jgi:RimJ/RimL family protein N-acetyltransferase
LKTEDILNGHHIRLEPLDFPHAEGLMAAAGLDAGLYQWSPVPQGIEETIKYIRTALDWKSAGTAVPYTIVRQSDDTVIGCTRFFLLERWDWRAGHPRFGNPFPDVGEIGYTWLSQAAIRTGANTEAKYLLLKLAFERWRVFRICLHADVRNNRSRAAIERIGGKFEGILRAHRMAVDGTPRDSARFSITTPDWTDVKTNLEKLLQRTY